MKKVLVTGGAGFIGSHVARALLRSGHEVVVLDDLSGGYTENLPDGCTFVQGSITDHQLIDRLFGEHRFSFVFHLAAYAAEGLSHFIKRFNYENNLIGSINLINASVNSGTVECFVFTSSIAVYGRNQVPMTESLVPQPEDPYGIAKYAVEQDLCEAHRMFGLNHVIFRPHNVYGENQNIGDPYRNVIGIFMRQILQGKPLTVFGDGQQMRAFSYIDDVAPIIAACVDRPAAWNEVYNIGADQPWTVLDLATHVCRAMGQSKPDLLHAEARNEVQIAYSSHDKVKRMFDDLIKNVPLDVGINKMAEWVKRNPIRSGQRFKNIEVPRNMPPIWQSLAE